MNGLKMNGIALTICKTFVQQFSGQETLLQLLPQEIQSRLEKIETPSTLKRETLFADFFEEIHFSWFAPYLRTFSEKDLSFCLSVFSSKQAEALQETLGYTHPLPQLTPFSKPFLKKELLAQLKSGHEIVPICFLPDHPLNRLLEIPQEMLFDLIFHLGLHDLAFEMRQIIVTETLKKIFSNLSKKEGKYLSTLLLHQEPLVFERLFLQKWDGTEEDLHKLIETRGLNRLGVCLYGASTSLQWYLTHRLPMNKASIVLKYCEKSSHVRAQQI